MLENRWIAVIVVVACAIQSQGADKYTDKSRPYEFGFRIGEEQHRHEKKDEKGLVMGEFGFLTADGVYHVTVYATDENGNFKILSMKNIRVHPYPGSGEKKGHSLPFPPSQNPPQIQGPTKNVVAATTSPPLPAKSCSHCSLPSTTSAKPLLTDIAVVARDNPASVNSQYPQDTQPINPVQVQFPTADQNYPLDINARSGFGQDDSQQGNQYDQNYPQNVNRAQDYPRQPKSGILSPGQTVETPYSNAVVDRNPKQISNYPQEPALVQQNPQYGPEGTQGVSKPTLISAQMQIVDKNTDINYKKPGEQEGLPKGLAKDDMLQLLYTFNYTVGFHGHFEEGYRNGAKQGYYYVTGRNGVRTRVDYVADEKGFRPKITQEVLDLISDDVPKAETEKDAKFGLKGYEFKWLYYPVESKKL